MDSTSTPPSPVPDAADSAPAASASPPVASPAALREDQVQNAVAFLSHPKVRGSSAASKRSFLERKGLNAEEVDEAFRRVPEPAATEAPAPALQPSSQAPAAQHAGLQSTLQHLQPGGALVPAAYPAAQQQQLVPAPPQSQPLRWSQVALGAGFFAAGVYAVKQLLWPYVWEAYDSWRERQGGGSSSIAPQVRAPPRPQEGDQQELPADVGRAVAEAIQAQTAELRSSVDALREVVAGMEEMRQREREEQAEAAAAAGGEGSGGGGVTVAELRAELRALAATLQESTPAGPKSTGGNENGGSSEGGVGRELAEIRGLLSSLLRSPDAGRAAGVAAAAERDPLSDASASQPLSSAAPANDSASSPAAISSATYTQPAGLVEELSSAGPAAGSGAAEPQAAEEEAGAGQANGKLSRSGSAASLASSAPSQPPHPPSYLEVLEMLEKGITPPGIRTDINDKPPNPAQPPPQPRLKPRPKPWERQQQQQEEQEQGRDAAPGSPPAATAAAAQPRNGALSPDRRLVDSFGGPSGTVLRQPGDADVAATPASGLAEAVVEAGEAPAESPAGQEEQAGKGSGPVTSAAAAASSSKELQPGQEAAEGEGKVVVVPGDGHAAAMPAAAAGATGASSSLEEQQGTPNGFAVLEDRPSSGQTAGAVGAGGEGSGPAPLNGSYKAAVLGSSLAGGIGSAAEPSSPSAAQSSAAEGAAPSAHHGIFRAPPRRAVSIFEAASSPSSPALITGGRFSPSSAHPGAAPQLTPPPPLLDGGAPADAAPTAGSDLAQPPYSPQPTVSPPAPGLAHQPAVSPPPWPLSSLSPAAGSPVPAGSIARPLAPGWRPPPIPVPTLLGSGGSKTMPASASSKSLGEDFSM